MTAKVVAYNEITKIATVKDQLGNLLNLEGYVIIGMVKLGKILEFTGGNPRTSRAARVL